MADIDLENLKNPEVKNPAVPEARIEKGPSPEKREIINEDRRVADELRREIEMMQIDESTKDEVKKKAEKIDFLGEDQKIKHLLDLAREKGLVFAIQVARKMNEPFLLDVLHDTLSREGYYKDFKK